MRRSSFFDRSYEFSDLLHRHENAHFRFVLFEGHFRRFGRSDGFRFGSGRSRWMDRRSTIAFRLRFSRWFLFECIEIDLRFAIDHLRSKFEFVIV